MSEHSLLKKTWTLVNDGKFPYISPAKWDIKLVRTTGITTMNLIRT